METLDWDVVGVPLKMGGKWIVSYPSFSPLFYIKSLFEYRYLPKSTYFFFKKYLLDKPNKAKIEHIIATY